MGSSTIFMGANYAKKCNLVFRLIDRESKQPEFIKINKFDFYAKQVDALAVVVIMTTEKASFSMCQRPHIVRLGMLPLWHVTFLFFLIFWMIVAVVFMRKDNYYLDVICNFNSQIPIRSYTSDITGNCFAIATIGRPLQLERLIISSVSGSQGQMPYVIESYQLIGRF